MNKLEGKIALITGGNSGIGLATAKQFVNEGAYVFITGRREPELAAAVKEIGSNVTGVQGDVSNLGDLDRLFAQIKREKGKLDIVFANAGGATFAPLGKITEEHYDSIFNINVKGLLFTVQKALPLMPDGASIILNASIVASKGLPPNGVFIAPQSRRAFVRADMDNGLEGSPHSRERGEPRAYRHARQWHTTEAGEEQMKTLPTVFRSAGSVHPTRSRRPWCFSHPTTAATSQERNCLWMAASHKCRPLIAENSAKEEFMLDPPPPVAVHGPGGRHEAVRHGLEVLLGVVQAEDDPAGSDPAQRQAFGTEIVLQHPVIARGLAVADGPDGGHVRDAERQPLIGQAAVETPRTFVPERIEVLVQLSNLGRCKTAPR